MSPIRTLAAQSSIFGCDCPFQGLGSNRVQNWTVFRPNSGLGKNKSVKSCLQIMQTTHLELASVLNGGVQ